MKNRRSADFEISAELSIYFDRYLGHVRTLFRGSAKHEGLWATQFDQPMGYAAL
jgi:hypothetical protein